MPKFIAKVDRSFLIEYPTNNSYFKQNYKPRAIMPVVKYPKGVPEPGEECLITTSIEQRFYNSIVRKSEAGPGSYKIVIRVYRLDEKPPYPIKFVLKAGRIAKYMRLPDVYKIIQVASTRFEKLIVYTTKEEVSDDRLQEMPDEQSTESPSPNSEESEP